VLDEGDTVQLVRIYSDRELSQVMETINLGLQPTADWQGRLRCLQTLQGLCLAGDICGSVFESQFLQMLRIIWDNVSITCFETHLLIDT
jgi:hypothetical protein